MEFLCGLLGYIILAFGFSYLILLVTLAVLLGGVVVAGKFDRRRIARFFGLAIPLLLLVALAPAPAAADDQEEDQEEEETEESRLFRTMGLATYGVFGGDAASTELALSAGLVEGNPLMEHRGVRLSTHVAVPLAVNAATAELYRSGHPKLALWARIAFVGLYGYATAHNLRQWNRWR